MRDFDFETLPWQLSAGDLAYYNREQKEKGKALVQMHTDLALVLQVLFHIALDCFRTSPGGLTTEQSLEECQQSSEVLCTMLLEYFIEHIIQPRLDLLKKATRIKVS